MKKQQPAGDYDETLPFEATQAATMLMERASLPDIQEIDSQEVATPGDGFVRSLAADFSAAKGGGVKNIGFNYWVVFENHIQSLL